MKGGILIDSLGIGQIASEIIYNINQINRLEEHWDISLFYSTNDVIPTPPTFAMYQDDEAWTFNGPIIATSITSAKKLINFLGPTKKYFYVTNLDWIHYTKHYKEYQDIYMNKELELVARSKEHYKIIEDCWRKPIDIIEGFNYEKIIDLFLR